jgi:hypothetical protein
MPDRLGNPCRVAHGVGLNAAHDSVSARRVSACLPYTWRGFSCPQAVLSGLVCPGAPLAGSSSWLGLLNGPRPRTTPKRL